MAATAMLLLGGASGSCDERGSGKEVAPSPEPAAAPTPAPAPAPAARVGTVSFEPAAPVAGQNVLITGGPVSFANGCQGIASTEAKVEGREIVVTWTAKPVDPTAMCTMALHDDPIIAQVDGLEAGTYTVRFDPSGGEATLKVGAPEPEDEPQTGAP